MSTRGKIRDVSAVEFRSAVGWSVRVERDLSGGIVVRTLDANGDEVGIVDLRLDEARSFFLKVCGLLGEGR